MITLWYKTIEETRTVKAFNGFKDHLSQTHTQYNERETENKVYSFLSFFHRSANICVLTLVKLDATTSSHTTNSSIKWNGTSDWRTIKCCHYYYNYNVLTNHSSFGSVTRTGLSRLLFSWKFSAPCSACSFNSTTSRVESSQPVNTGNGWTRWYACCVQEDLSPSPLSLTCACEYEEYYLFPPSTFK